LAVFCEGSNRLFAVHKIRRIHCLAERLLASEGLFHGICFRISGVTDYKPKVSVIKCCLGCLLVYLTMIFQHRVYVASNDRMIIDDNLGRVGRKLSWPDLRYYPNVI
jgi:hypothetical protein